MDGVLSDVTAAKQAESEARQQRRETARLMRQSVLGELSGAIAHELNQPLTAILSNAEAAHELLNRETFDAPLIQEIITDIIEEDNRAGEVVRRIRALMTRGESASEPVDLNSLVESTLRLLRGECVRRGIEVATQRSILPMVLGDPVQLQQVLLNVMMNAMDAMSAEATTRREMNIATRLTGNTVEIVVSDTGHGVAAENQVQLFKPFFTTKPHGLGLGLSICSNIVRSHGGNLSLKNNPDGGATVVIVLPAMEQRRAAE